jgi:hypothetical protein
MEIIFRPLPSNHQLVFSPSIECDTMSVTANPMGASPLKIISSKFNWNQLRVHHAATRANRFSKVAVLRDLKPKLILVPRTQGENDASDLIDEMIMAAEEIHTETINFTHYGYVQKKLPEAEIVSVLRRLAEKNSNTLIRVLIWDIDSRYLEQTRVLCQNYFYKKLGSEGMLQ